MNMQSAHVRPFFWHRWTRSAVPIVALIFALFLILLGSVGLLSSCSQPSSIPSPSPGAIGKKIFTVAGTGTSGASGDNGSALSAQLDGPEGICFDTAGSLYIADYTNSKIRMVTPSGVITTVAGDGASGYNGDNIAATTAALNRPSSVTVDPAGNLYIADSWNDRIRKAATLITTAAGTGSPSFYGDNGPATAAAVAFPSGVYLDDAGDLYIADQSNNRVRIINALTGYIGTVAGNGTAGTVANGGQATATPVSAPYSVIVDTSGNIYISQPNSNVVRKVSPSGVISPYAGTGAAGYSGDGAAATSAELDYPTALALDSSGDLYIADSWNDVIREVNASSGVITTVVGDGTAGFSPDGTAATSANLMLPMGLAFDKSGNLYVSDFGNNVVRVVK